MAPTHDRMNRDELHYAALDNDAARTAELIAEGTDPIVTDDADWTPLHSAAQDNAYDTARLLVEAGANVNARNEYGNAPLWVGLMFGKSDTRLPIYTLLKVAGTDLNAPNNNGKSILDLVRSITWDDPGLAELFKDELAE